MDLHRLFDGFLDSLHLHALLGVSIIFAALYCSAAVPKISGTVTDLKGKPISNSTVVVENKKTHRRISVQTDVHGRFAVRYLKGTDYSVFVVAESAQGGFRLQLDPAESARAHGHDARKAPPQGSLLSSQVASRGH